MFDDERAPVVLMAEVMALLDRLRAGGRMKTAPDCLECGACCVSLQDQDVFCDVEVEDLDRLKPAWVKKNVLFTSVFDAALAVIDGANMPHGAIRTKWAKQRTGPLAGREACTCVALRGSVMSRVSCSIYENRPRTCKVAVVPGDRTCLELRRMIMDAVKRAK